MSGDSGWGPWIDHGGNDKPADGLFVEKEYANGLILTGIVGGAPITSHELGIPYYSGETFANSWIWSGPGDSVPIIRYRLKKPRALLDLIQLIADLPAPVCPVAPMHQPMKTDGVIA